MGTKRMAFTARPCMASLATLKMQIDKKGSLVSNFYITLNFPVLPPLTKVSHYVCSHKTFHSALSRSPKLRWGQKHIPQHLWALQKKHCFSAGHVWTFALGFFVPFLPDDRYRGREMQAHSGIPDFLQMDMFKRAVLVKEVTTVAIPAVKAVDW